MIACTTVIGRGLPKVEGTRAAHSARITKEIAAAAREHLDWPHPPFEVPAPILQAWRDAGRRSLPAYEAWQARVQALTPEKRRLLDRLREGRLPDGWERPLLAFRDRALQEPRPEYGIKLSGDIVDLLSDAIPELLSGAPDLEGATGHKRKLAPFSGKSPDGRYVHYGIREHAMGSMLNGMAAHGGVVPVGVTYLVFSDYMRPTLRLAAMMGLPVQFVFSHDSIGIGRNGPTHQPVEYLASLRAIPNMLVLRPADAVEAAECWEVALSRRTGPSSLIFARQPLSRCAAARPGRTSPAAAPTWWPGRRAGAVPPSWRPARRWGSRSRLARSWKPRACRPRWSRCPPGSCSRSRTRPIARRCSVPVRCGWPWKLRCAWAGTAISGPWGASSA